MQCISLDSCDEDQVKKGKDYLVKDIRVGISFGFSDID